MKSHYPATTDLPTLNVPVGSSFVRVENANGRHLERYFPSKSDYLIDQVDAEGFAQYLRGKVSSRTTKDYLILVQACWKWAEKSLSCNPWFDVLVRLSQLPSKRLNLLQLRRFNQF